MGLLALMIKLESPGPVLFRQKRYGFNHNLFDCWKFRTMHHHMTDAHAEVLTRRGDARVTRVGGDSSASRRLMDLGLIRGNWPVIGQLPAWERHRWPMPAFGRREELTGRCWRVEYDDDDLNSRPRETLVAREECDRLPEDGAAGSAFVEARMTRLLGARAS